MSPHIPRALPLYRSRQLPTTGPSLRAHFPNPTPHLRCEFVDGEQCQFVDGPHLRCKFVDGERCQFVDGLRSARR